MTEGAVPRSMEATTPYAAARAERQRLARPSGWWGIVVFIAAEATLFGTLFGSYFYLRFRAVHWPPPGIEPPPITLPLVLAGVLVATSVPMQLALAAARGARLGAARAALLLALVVQSGYFAMQMHLYVHDLHKVSPQESAYGSIYFVLLGAHHTHVALGLLLSLWLLLRLGGGITSYRLIALNAAVLYWHFVNVLALLVVGAQLSANV